MKKQVTNLLQTERLTPLTSEDAFLFRTRFGKVPVCYAHSWLYTLRASRMEQGHFGFKYENHQTLFSVGFRKGAIQIIIPHGGDAGNQVLKLCREITSIAGGKMDILVKKVGEEIAEDLLTTGLFVEAQASAPELLEDDLFPESMLDLDFTFPGGSTINPAAQNLGKKYRTFERNQMSFKRFDDPSGFSLEFLLNGLRQLSKNNHEKWLANKLILEEVHRRPGWYQTSVFMHDEVLHGLYVSERLNTETAGLYCALTSQAYPGMTEWLDVEFFKHLHQSGIRKLYLGGSETEGVYMYVKKLLPKPVDYRTMSLSYTPSLKQKQLL